MPKKSCNDFVLATIRKARVVRAGVLSGVGVAKVFRLGNGGYSRDEFLSTLNVLAEEGTVLISAFKSNMSPQKVTHLPSIMAALPASLPIEKRSSRYFLCIDDSWETTYQPAHHKGIEFMLSDVRLYIPGDGRLAFRVQQACEKHQQAGIEA